MRKSVLPISFLASMFLFGANALAAFGGITPLDRLAAQAWSR
jgi:hypothetical protein